MYQLLLFFLILTQENEKQMQTTLQIDQHQLIQLNNNQTKYLKNTIQMTQDECILCAEVAEFIGVGECNHEPICYRCIYKMRVISKNNACPICKTACKQMIIMPEFQPFASIKKQVIPDKTYGDIFYVNEQGRKAFQKLTLFKCFIKVNGKPCKHDKQFPSIAFLKKHLKEDHHRHICDICFQKKTCVLEEQKLYTFNQLNKHMQRGDIDQFGNIVFLHPYCNFCKIHFFDDDQFRRHINLQHMTCNVCGPQKKYIFYKRYDNLQTHYKMSHYICMQKDCLDKKFIAFKTADELKVHRMQIHEKQNKKIDIKQLCGFQNEWQSTNDQVVVIKDKQGIDMQCQFLSLKKSKNRTLAEADQQQDQLFDVRDFYNCQLDQDQHAQKVFSKKPAPKQTKKQENKQEQKNQPQDKKKKYISKKELETEKIQKSSVTVQNQKFLLEDLLLVQSFHWTKMTNDQFDFKLKTVLSEDLVRKLSDLRKQLFKKKIKQETFVSDYFRILKPAGLKLAYNIFPHFLRTIIHDDVKHKLDDQFLRHLKQLPSKNDKSLLKISNKYSDFFSRFLKEIQKNIQSRIVNGQLSIKKPVTKDKARLFQIVGVVRRIKIHEMAKLKFASNFGIQKDTVNYLVSKVFKQDVSQIQRRLSKIQNSQFLDLYVFIKYCQHAIIHASDMQIEKHKIHENILEDFLYDRPHLEEKYGLKKDELKTMEQKVQFEKLQEQKKAKKHLKQLQKKNLSIGFTTKTNFSLQDKGDFPQLVIGKKSQQEKASLKQIVSEAKFKPVTYQKKINEMFPTLGQEVPTKLENKKSSQQSTEPQKLVVKEEKKEKAWWQKINEKKKNPDEPEEPQVIKVRQGKNKKQKWVSVNMNGMFGR